MCKLEYGIELSNSDYLHLGFWALPWDGAWLSWVSSVSWLVGVGAVAGTAGGGAWVWDTSWSGLLLFYFVEGLWHRNVRRCCGLPLCNSGNMRGSICCCCIFYGNSWESVVIGFFIINNLNASFCKTAMYVGYKWSMRWPAVTVFKTVLGSFNIVILSLTAVSSNGQGSLMAKTSPIYNLWSQNVCTKLPHWKSIIWLRMRTNKTVGSSYFISPKNHEKCKWCSRRLKMKVYDIFSTWFL